MEHGEITESKTKLTVQKSHTLLTTNQISISYKLICYFLVLSLKTDSACSYINFFDRFHSVVL
jgi:hypothetical protein